MHRNVLKVISVRKHEICVELQSTLLKATKYADNLFPWEQLYFCIHYLTLRISPLCRIGVLQLKHVERWGIILEATSHTIIDVVL